ncbi:MAG: hypothetical protein IPH09_15215 [bacterium]|nr:hypothetical protein [bacterium]
MIVVGVHVRHAGAFFDFTSITSSNHRNGICATIMIGMTYQIDNPFASMDLMNRPAHT